MRRHRTLTPANTGALIGAAALAWLGGVAWQLQQAGLWPAAGYTLCFVPAAIVALLLVAQRRISPLSALLAAAALFALGTGSTGLRAGWRLAEALPAALEGRDLRVTGVVASLPQRGPSGLRFRFDVEAGGRAGGQGGQGGPIALPPQISLGWYTGFHEDAVLTPPQQSLAAGQRWQFTVRLRQPHGNLNPHGFDSELYLFEQGVRAVGYVRDGPPPQLVERAAGHPIERWRQRVRDAIDAHVADRRIAGVLAALAVGDQSAIEREDWELFRSTGIAHLVSISGLHVTMFAWLAGAVIAAGWRRSGRAMLRLPAQTVGLWGGLLAALAYAVFSGWGVPSQRTVWMLAGVTLLRAAGCRWPWPLTLLAAAVLVTAIDPWALLQPGFWLSFMAVGLLMASSGAQPLPVSAAPHNDPALPGWRRHAAALWAAVHGGVRTQLIATLGLAPLTLVFFQQLSLVGVLANLVAIPVVTLLITPLALLGALAWPLWTVAAWVVTRLVLLLQWLAGWPGAVWWAPVAPGWAQAAGLLAAALLVLPIPWRVRALALPLALPLLLPPLDVPPAGQFDVVAADVGQGTAVLVRTATHLMVYDAGPQYSRDSDAGQRVLLPLLRARGETRIDQLVLSHRDNDHTGGAIALLRGMSVAALSTSVESGHPILLDAQSRAIPVTRCAAGQHWQWDGVDFSVLAPPSSDYALALRPNAVSCVVKVSAGRTSLLLTGDIEQAQEAALVAEQGTALHADVLVVPHHGSKTSSTPAFIDAVAPRIAVFQAGYRSRFGHPVPEVVARYSERSIAIAASPACGAWQWRSSEAGTTAGSDGATIGRCERDLARRYWHHGVALPESP